MATADPQEPFRTAPPELEVPIRVEDVLAEVAAGLRPLAERKGLRLEVVAPETGLVTLADRYALRKVLLRLTGNAIRCTAEGEVRLELAARWANCDTTLEVRVAATGGDPLTLAFPAAVEGPCPPLP